MCDQTSQSGKKKISLTFYVKSHNWYAAQFDPLAKVLLLPGGRIFIYQIFFQPPTVFFASTCSSYMCVCLRTCSPLWNSTHNSAVSSLPSTSITPQLNEPHPRCNLKPASLRSHKFLMHSPKPEILQKPPSSLPLLGPLFIRLPSDDRLIRCLFD